MNESRRNHGCGSHDAGALRLEEALARLRELLTPISDTHQLAVRDALGRVLGEDIHSPHDVPAHDNSAMDGYAVRHADAEAAAGDGLRLVGSAFAGHPFAGELGAGECVRIMTGGVVPAGADTVVMQEHARVADERVIVERWPRAGEHVRRAGEDLARGGIVLAAGRRLSAADLGLLASVGIPEVAVRRVPRVAFFSTGDELRSLGEPLGPGEIHDSNRYTLFGMLTRLGVEVRDLGVVADERDAVRTALDSAARQADVVITTGGVSVGEADYLTELLAEVGEVGFWAVAVKPGRPLAHGRIGEAAYFGLAGNPVSAMVTFHQIVVPALRHLAGEAPRPPRRFRVRCQQGLRKRPGRLEFQRGVLVPGADGETEVRPLAQQGSGVLRSMSEAHCFIVLPFDGEDVQAGERVEVEPFDAVLSG
ncbi:molybdopterin molybdotransferase MoeA [Arhodomonas sp. AD133]|uniref:molybdopterin molybdotransferase MoeA n=1 Tax=Arhodomonas sp. AD133 TaxID=3415009 RepID=UPI003EC06E1E